MYIYIYIKYVITVFNLKTQYNLLFFPEILKFQISVLQLVDFYCLHLGSLLLGDVCYSQGCYFFISMLPQQVSLCSHSGAGNNCLLISLSSSPIFLKAFIFHILFFFLHVAFL